MNNKFEEYNEEDRHQPNSMNQNHHSSNPRVIEIPVQHFGLASSPTNSNSVPNNRSGLGNNGLYNKEKLKNPQHPQSQDFFNNRNNHSQGIFEDFHQSPFDLIDGSLRNRSLFNREQPFGSRFDEFFRPNLSTSPHQQSSADQFLNRDGKSPIREVLRQASPNPARQSPTHISNHRQSPTISRTESPKFRTESPKFRTESPKIYLEQVSSKVPAYNHHQSGSHQIPIHQIPIQHGPIHSDFTLRTESPVRQKSPQPQYPKEKSPVLHTAIVLTDLPQKIPKSDINSKSDFIKNQEKEAEKSHQDKLIKQHQHKFKEQPTVNLPEVIPLPEPEPHHHHPPKNTNGEQTQNVNMGNTFQGQHSASASNKRHAGPQNQSDFAHPHPHQSSPQPQSQPQGPSPQPQPPAPAQKTQKEKLDKIAIDLDNYEKELATIKSGCGKKDKHYLKLDEFITRCLLKLDEIEKTDDIIALRKSLIVTSNKLLDQLESKAMETPSSSDNIGNNTENLSSTPPPKVENENVADSSSSSNCNENSEEKNN